MKAIVPNYSIWFDQEVKDKIIDENSVVEVESLIHKKGKQ